MKNAELETVLTTRMKADMLTWVEANPGCQSDLLELALSDHPQLGWRAAWVLGDSVRPDDAGMIAAVPRMLNRLPELNDGHQRELLKVVLRLQTGSEADGLLFDCAMRLWEDTRKSPGLRYYAMMALLKVCVGFPELRREVDAVSGWKYLMPLSPGIRRGVEKMLKK